MEEVFQTQDLVGLVVGALLGKDETAWNTTRYDPERASLRLVSSLAARPDR